MKAVVFGAGPAGLLAAHAATLAGMNVDVFAMGSKSSLYGAQYLHMEIPEIPCGEQRSISVRLSGTADEYREKVYGPDYTGPVSPAALHDGHYAWDIRRAYDFLWELYGGDRMKTIALNRGNVQELYDTSMQFYEFRFCALPLKQLCHIPTHRWESQQVFAIGDAPELGLMCPVGCPDETMQYDGTRHVGWYRSARIFGHTTCEWPGRGRKPPLQNLATVQKPLATDCNCYPGWTRLGRYGEWKKGVLVHDAFLKAWETIKTGAHDALD